MKRTSPESTYGLVVNHSHRNTEAAVSYTRPHLLTVSRVHRVTQGLELPVHLELWLLVWPPALLQAEHRCHHLRPASVSYVGPSQRTHDPSREMPKLVPLSWSTSVYLESLPVMIAQRSGDEMYRPASL